MDYKATQKNKTPQTNTNTPAEKLHTLLALYPAKELQQFYTDKSQQMLLLNSVEIEQNEALSKLLQLLTEIYRQ